VHQNPSSTISSTSSMCRRIAAVCGFGILALDCRQNPPVAGEEISPAALPPASTSPRVAQQVMRISSTFSTTLLPEAKSYGRNENSASSATVVSPRASLTCWRCRISSISEISSGEAWVAARAANGGSSILRKSRSSPTRACLRLRAFAKGLTNESVEISADDGAGTLPRLDQTPSIQDANCVANGAAADLQHLRKFAFRGQLSPGFSFFRIRRSICLATSS